VPFVRQLSFLPCALGFLLASCSLMAQSVYTLETLPADEFVPSAGFDTIVGSHMDPQGNIAGWAANAAKSHVGFYWPANGNPVKRLVFATSSSRNSDCEPRGMDAAGLVYLYCPDLAISAVYDPASGSLREFKSAKAQTFEVSGAAGDSWTVGQSFIAGHTTGVRRSPSGSLDMLSALSPEHSSIAAAVNSTGAATGQSLPSSALAVPNEPAARQGRAVLWMPGATTAELIPAPVAAWLPAFGRAVNQELVVTGSTSLVSTSIAAPGACAASPSGRPQPGTFGFVSSLSADGNRITEFLPLVAGDAPVASITPSSINIHSNIVGARDALDCLTSSAPPLRRAILWKPRDGGWSANLLDRYPISFEVGVCTRDLILMEARAINDDGQITGAGSCIDSEGTRRAIAYRLTPTGVEAP
jgi:hypothetical protein